ncbi:MAG TPA: hypothetical protein P5150_07140 [Candidatus Ratteibacteria bacterium]|nr:hypothetical protein [bacterium]HRR96482.1 hypothetical protein [Candidatus Ratteibacteria bacterium]
MGKKLIILIFYFAFIPSIFCLSKEDYNVILKRNIFTTPYIEEKEIKKESILKPPPPPSLNTLIKAKGVILIGETGYGIVEVKGKDIIVRKNEKILGAEVVKIENDSIVFFYNDKEEKLQIEKITEKGNFVKATPEINVKIEENINTNKEEKEISQPEFKEPVVVDFEKTISELKNDKDLFNNVNIIPNIEEGNVNGFKINNLPENSIPFQYGLRNGDIIYRVNGIVINSMPKGLAVYNQIVKSGTKTVTVEVIRNGSPVVFSYTLK